MYDEDKGERDVGKDGKPMLRILNGDPCHLAPCRDSERGCPKGTPEKPNTLWPENELCYEHYLQCKAVGRFPKEPVVERNAAVIKEAEDAIERGREVEFQSALLNVIASSMVK